MPCFICWPSSLAGPVNGAEIPNRISLSVMPRTALLTVPTIVSSPNGLVVGESAACCPWAEGGICCACAVADGAATGAAAIPAAGARAMFAGASFAVSRGSAGLEICMGRESDSSSPTRCNSGFPKTANNATTIANTATLTKRAINGSKPFSSRAGGSETGSGNKDRMRRS